MILDRDGGGAHQRERMRGGDLRPTCEVDRADHRAGGGIVHGRRGATPGWTTREKCSDPRICTSLSRASAVPGALVPAPCSLQSAPGTKFIASALRRLAVALHP